MLVCWTFQGNHNHLIGQQIRQVAPNQQYPPMQPTQVSSCALQTLGTSAVLIDCSTFTDNNLVMSRFSLQNMSHGYTPYGSHIGIQPHPSQTAGIGPSSYGNQGFQGGHPGTNPGMVDSLRPMQQRPSGYVHQQAPGTYGHTMQNTQRSVTDLFKILSTSYIFSTAILQ